MQGAAGRGRRASRARALVFATAVVALTLSLPVPTDAAASLEALGSYNTSASNGAGGGQSFGQNDEPFMPSYHRNVAASAPSQPTPDGQSGSAFATSIQDTELTREQNVLRAIDTSANVSTTVNDGATGPDADADTHLEIQFSLPRTKRLTLQGELAISSCSLPGEQAEVRLRITRADTDAVVSSTLVVATNGCAQTVPISERIEFRGGQRYRFFLQATVGADDASGSSEALWDIALRGQVQEDQLGCGDEVTTSAVLKADLLCNGDGLYIGAPNITLDLNGHRISGDGEDTGIDNTNGHDGVTIHNGAVSGFETGIHVTNGDQVTLRDLRVEQNANHGVWMLDSSLSTVRGVRSFDNGADGMNLFCDGCRVLGNRLLDNAGDGIEMEGDSLTSGQTTIKDNRASGNDTSGIKLDHSNQNTLIGNEVSRNEVAGFVVNAADNTFRSNIADANHGNGFQLGGAPRNAFVANIARSNELAGFSLTSSDLNAFGPGDRANGNDEHGFLLLNSDGNILKEVTANGNHDAGIALALSEANTIRASTAKGNDGTEWAGIHLFGSDSNTITGNRGLEANEGYGLHFIASDDNDAIGNVANANKLDGITVADDTSGTHLVDNKAKFNKRDGIGVYHPATTGTGNKATGNAETNCRIIIGAPVACAG